MAAKHLNARQVGACVVVVLAAAAARDVLAGVLQVSLGGGLSRAHMARTLLPWQPSQVALPGALQQHYYSPVSGLFGNHWVPPPSLCMCRNQGCEDCSWRGRGARALQVAPAGRLEVWTACRSGGSGSQLADCCQPEVTCGPTAQATRLARWAVCMVLVLCWPRMWRMLPLWQDHVGAGGPHTCRPPFDAMGQLTAVQLMLALLCSVASIYSSVYA